MEMFEFVKLFLKQRYIQIDPESIEKIGYRTVFDFIIGILNL